MPRKFVRRLLSGLLCCHFILCSSAQADVLPREKVVQIFSKSVYNSDIVDAKARSYGLSDAKTKLMHGYYRSLAKDRKFIERLADEFISVGFNDSENLKDPKAAMQQALVLMGICIANLQQKGLQRMEDQDFRQMLQMTGEVCRKLPFKACKIYNTEGMSRNFAPYIPLFEKTVWRTLSVGQLSTWYGMQLRAIDAELAGFPPSATMSLAEQKIAEKALGTAFDRALKQMPQQKAGRIARTFVNLQMATDMDACEASVFFLDLCANAPGTTGALIRRSLLLQLSK